jgi:hypothetical protein
LDIFENIEVKEGNIGGPPGPDGWNIQLKATKVKHPKLENIAPEDLLPPPPMGASWPVRVYDEAVVRPPMEEEKEQDLVIQPPANKAKERKAKLLKDIKEKADGLESNL